MKKALLFLCLMPVCVVEGGKKKIIKKKIARKKEQTEEQRISSSLIDAVEQNDKYKVSQLMKEMNWVTRDKWAHVALEYAVQKKRHKCFKKMLAKSFLVDRHKLLSLAITCNSHLNVKHLFKFSVKFESSKLVPYFDQTIDDCQWKIALQLLAHIGDVETRHLSGTKDNGDTFLHTCARQGDTGNFDRIKDRLVKQLCERKDIDINAKNYEGKTALAIALELLDEKVAKILLDTGANTDECTDQEKQIIEKINAGKSFHIERVLRDAYGE